MDVPFFSLQKTQFFFIVIIPLPFSHCIFGQRGWVCLTQLLQHAAVNGHRRLRPLNIECGQTTSTSMIDVYQAHMIDSLTALIYED